MLALSIPLTARGGEWTLGEALACAGCTWNAADRRHLACGIVDASGTTLGHLTFQDAVAWVLDGAPRDIAGWLEARDHARWAQ